MAYTSFAKLKSELAHRPGVTSPAGLAASIAARKYGRKALQHAAETGTSLKGHRTVKNERHRALREFVRKQHGR